jgi:hypothetical protein
MGNTGSKQIKLWVSLSLKPSLHERFFSKKCEKSVRPGKRVSVEHQSLPTKKLVTHSESDQIS